MKKKFTIKVSIFMIIAMMIVQFSAFSDELTNNTTLNNSNTILGQVSQSTTNGGITVDVSTPEAINQQVTTEDGISTNSENDINSKSLIGTKQSTTSGALYIFNDSSDINGNLQMNVFNSSTSLSPMMCLDTPINGQTVTGNTLFGGWVLDPAGVSKIEIIIDGIVMGTTGIGVSRLDVYAAYPQYNIQNAGFNCIVNVTNLTNGSHSVVIRETNTQGIPISQQVAINVSNTASQQSMNVSFPESTNQNQSKTVTIDNLGSVSSVTVNTGTATPSVNGNNVTINVANGAPSRTSTPSQPVSTSQTNQTGVFPNTVSYNQGGYSGTLSKSGSMTSTVSTNYYDYKIVTDSQTSSTNNFPATESYNSGGYTGTLAKNGSSTSYIPVIIATGNAHMQSYVNNFPDTYNYSYNGYTGIIPKYGASFLANGTNLWQQNYQGTVKKPGTEADRIWQQNYIGTVYGSITNYTQNYSGTVYGTTVNYYTYNVTVYYVTARPNAPTGLIAKVNGSYVILNWNSYTGPVNIMQYNIYDGLNNCIGSVPSNKTSCTIETNLIDSQVTFKIAAVDVNGNVSDFSNEATVSTEDYGNDFDHAYYIPNNVYFEGTIDFPGDIDYFIFSPDISGTYTITSTGTTDTYGTLYNTDHSVLASNDDFAGLGANFQISYNLTAGQLYYFSVRHYNPNCTGDYGIYLIYGTPAPKPPANSAPTVTVSSPTLNQVFDENSTVLSPIINVSDPNNATLTCSVYVDNETLPRSTKTQTNTSSTKTVTFDPINFGTLVNGNHNIRFGVSDGSYTSYASVTIKVDRLPPSLGKISTTSTDTSLTINVIETPTDNVTSIDANPYRYTIGSNVGNWTSNTTNLFNTLTPNTSYDIKFEVKDQSGHISNSTQTIYTKAQTPTAIVNNATKDSINLNITDNNPSYTQYQIMINGKYVTTSGTLSSLQKWLTLNNKNIVITGLTANTSYSINVIARNSEGVLTQNFTLSTKTTN